MSQILTITLNDQFCTLTIVDSISRTSYSGGSSTSSRISTTAIEQIIESLKNSKHRYSTRKTYRNVWKNFNQFFIRLDRKPNSWEERIVLFVGFLIESKKQSSTIRSYISAIRAVLLADGVQLNENKYLITSLTKACKLKNDKVRTRLPIQKAMLTILIEKVGEVYHSQDYLRIMYQAMFITAYFGLFRVGEITSGDHPVRAVDVHIADNKQKLCFILHSSKTHDQSSPPQLIKISSVEKTDQPSCSTAILMSRQEDGFPCPYELMRKYISIRGPYLSKTEPLFVHGPKVPCRCRLHT